MGGYSHFEGFAQMCRILDGCCADFAAACLTSHNARYYETTALSVKGLAGTYIKPLD